MQAEVSVRRPSRHALTRLRATLDGMLASVDVPTVLVCVAAIAVSCAIGAAWAFIGPPPLVALLVPGAIWLLLVLKDWRLGLLGALVYIPFSGVATVLLYPNTVLAPLLKDAAFLCPAFASFLIAATRRGSLVKVPFLATYGLIGFSLIVVVQMFNPNVHSLLVGMIGAKVWLLSVPLFLLGSAIAQSATDMRRVLRLLVYVAIVPSVVSIITAVLLYSNQPEYVTSLYGPAWEPMTQESFATNLEDGGRIFRIPSTLPSAFQYHVYSCIISALAFVMWRLDRESGGRSQRALMVFLLVVCGGFLSGSRGSALMLPILLVLVATFTGQRKQLAVILPLGALLVILAFAISGNRVDSFVGYSIELALHYLDETFYQPLVSLGFDALIGFGTGTDTAATRYAFDDLELFYANYINQESWIIKVILELGIVGLLSFATFLGTVLYTAWRQHGQLTDPMLKLVNGASAAILVWSMLYGLKAIHLDLDPLTVYFWLFAGVIVGLKRPATSPEAVAVDTSAATHDTDTSPRREVHQGAAGPASTRLAADRTRVVTHGR